MKSKIKKTFSNYILSVLFACLVFSIYNFAISTVKMFLTPAATPVYSQIVDSVSATPEDHVEITTTPIIENKAKTISGNYRAIAKTTKATSTTYATAVKATSTPVSGNYISINGRAIHLEYKQPSGASLIVPNNHAAYYRNFIYGHNTSGVFAYLNRISTGETITVSINGEAKTYRVVAKERKAIGDINMSSLVYDKTYAHILMTCVGDGSTHRDIIYLN